MEVPLSACARKRGARPFTAAASDDTGAILPRVGGRAPLQSPVASLTTTSEKVPLSRSSWSFGSPAPNVRAADAAPAVGPVGHGEEEDGTVSRSTITVHGASASGGDGVDIAPSPNSWPNEGASV